MPYSVACLALDKNHAYYLIPLTLDMLMASPKFEAFEAVNVSPIQSLCGGKKCISLSEVEQLEYRNLVTLGLWGVGGAAEWAVREGGAVDGGVYRGCCWENGGDKVW
ncbi:hypothetical protein Tco_1133886 [Tanacetum coccineum]